MNIGLFGGTFDPIHIGHLVAAEQAREQLKLDEVWFIPAPTPPHKDGCAVSPADHRLHMVQLAVADHPKFRVSRLEFERDGDSYTVDTISVLRERYPGHSFFFIVGTDMVADLPNWHRIRDLVTMVRFVGLQRPGFRRPNLPHYIADRVLYADMLAMDLSATHIRNRVKKEQSIRYVVPDCVRYYIEEHRLYEKP